MPRAAIALRLRDLALLAVLLASPPAAAFAQTSTALPLVLHLPASGRYLGLGNTAVAGRDDDVIFYNPAQLTVVRGSSISAQRFSPGNTTGAISTVVAFWGGGLGVGAQWLGHTTNSMLLPSAASSLDSAGVASASSMAATLAFARAVKGIRFGIATKVAQDAAPLERSTSGFVDLGVEKDIRQIGFGLAIQNIGTFGVSDVLEPARATFGAMAEAPLANLISSASPFLDAALAAQVSVLRDGWVKPSGGMEITFAWIAGYGLTVRGGARRPAPGERPLTAGATLTADRIRFDYAIETREGESLSHRVGVRIR